MFVGSILHVAKSQGFSHSLHSRHLLPVYTPPSYPLQKNHLPPHRRQFTSLAEVGAFVQANSQLVSLAGTVITTSGIVWLSGWRANRFLCRHTEEVVKPMFIKMQAELNKESSGVKVEISSLRVELVKEISGVKEQLGKEISSVKEQFGKEISSVRVEISGVKEELSKEISGLKEQFGALTVKVDNLTKVTDKLEVQVNGLRESIEGPNGLRREITLQSGEIARLRDKIEGSKSATAFMKGFNEESEGRLFSHEKEAAKLIHESAKPTDPLDKTRVKVAQRS